MKKAVSQDELRKELHGKVQDIVDNWRQSPEQIAEFLAFAARFRQYSYNNTRLIFAQKPDAAYIAPASAYRIGLPDKDGKPLSDKPIWIKKGEHALRIWCPTVRTCVVDPETNEWISVSHLSDETREKAKSENWVRKEIHGFTLVPVFDVGQTECPQELYPKLLGFGDESPDTETAIQAAVSYASDALHCEVVESEDLRSASVRGYFYPDANRIVLSDLLRGEGKLSTLLHEIGHAELHHDPTAVKLSTAQKELEADMYALLLERLAGVETTDGRKKHLAEHYKMYLREVSASLSDGETLSLGADSEPFTRVLERYREQSPMLEKALRQAKEVDLQRSQSAVQHPNPQTVPTPGPGRSGLSF